jgi:P-type Cu+ transporter
MVIDPVCGKELEQHEAQALGQRHDRVYYFCSNECKDRFDQHPAKYLRRQPEPVQAADRDV